MEYAHKIEVDPTSWYLRFYGWLWNTNPKKVTLCTFVWAYFPLFSIPMFVIRLFIVAIERLQVPVRWSTFWDAHTSDEVRHPKPPREGPSKASRVLDKLSNVIAWGIHLISAIWYPIGRTIKKLPTKVITYAFFGLATLVALAAMSFLIYICATHLNIVLKVLIFFGIVAGGVIALVLTIVGLVYAVDRIGQKRIEEWFKSRGESIKTFFILIGRGIMAIKSQTCPEMIVKERK